MTIRQFEVVALSIPVIFNKHRDHDPEGMMYALARHTKVLQHEAEMYRASLNQAGTVHDDGCECSDSHVHGHTVDPKEKFKPHPLVRPLVLRAAKGDTVQIRFKNLIKCRKTGMHLVGPGTDAHGDGSKAGNNSSSLAKFNEIRHYEWSCDHEGVFLFQDIGDPGGDEQGTNAHGLFGALIVEPEGAWWTDSTLDFDDPQARVDDGLFVDVHQRSLEELKSGQLKKPPFAGQKRSTRPPKYPDPKSSFREYVVFIHDEPEVWELKHKSEKEYRHCHEYHCAKGTHGGVAHGGAAHDDGHAAALQPLAAQPHTSTCHHGHMIGPAFEGLNPLCTPDSKYDVESHATVVHGANVPCEPGEWRVLAPHAGSLMCLNYRAEPMKNREHQIWERQAAGLLKTTVINEEQHHSSWMFGDPDTPILKAYMGDPVRIRLVHAGVKETHVFHLHVYEWHADPGNRKSPLIDAITIAPGTAHTIDPLFGAGNVQAVPGDVIWHCHLYPHFHMGMWGMLRSFDTLQTGVKGALLRDPGNAYWERYIGEYPDGSPITRLAVLPDRAPPPRPTPTKPGFPLFIAGETGQKSPVPPWPRDFGGIAPAARPEYDYRLPTALELAAMNATPRLGELFTYFPHPEKRSLWMDDLNQKSKLVRRDARADVDMNVSVGHGKITYNSHGWHDPDGHFYYLDSGQTSVKPEEPFFFRARQGDVLNLTFTNKIGFRKPQGPGCAADRSPVPQPALGQLEQMYFDQNIPPSDNIVVGGKTPAECGLHVHLVKFDPICADGAATGWNYISGPSDGKKMVYRWWCDEEFGVIFCHDHLFANTRQRHGLFGALIVEPENSVFLDPLDQTRHIITGTKAVIERADGKRFREFGIGIGDWIAMYDKDGKPLEAPEHPGSHGDNGIMCVNYKSAPLRERGDLPERWFFDRQKEEDQQLTFDTYPGEEMVLRVIQGSHEEQHSFQANGLNWRRFRKDAASPQRSQQTMGISEAFSFRIDQPYRAGDYLWRFSGQEDTWLGCWGRIRAHDQAFNGLWPIAQASAQPLAPPASSQCRRYRVCAVQETICYRDPPAALVDAQGLRFVVTAMAPPGGQEVNITPTVVEPMILRCLQGEWVEIELENVLPAGITAEAFHPRLPVEDDRNQPPISRHVSLEADLLTQCVRQADGSAARPAAVVTVPPAGKLTFLFHANVEPGAVLLQDMADIRNHRHHGLFGALIIEPVGTRPLAVADGQPTARADSPEAWTGARATIVAAPNKRVEECVLLLHDGIRYVNPVPIIDKGTGQPILNPPDMPGDPGETGPDTEDQGQKAFNYRSSRLDVAFAEVKSCKNEAGEEEHPNQHDRLATDWFPADPPTPVFHVASGAEVEVKLVCAADKPRNHSFHLHGHAWKEYAYRGNASVVHSTVDGLATGAARTLAFTANRQAGDYLYRSGVVKWSLAQGLWGILRVHPGAARPARTVRTVRGVK